MSSVNYHILNSTIVINYGGKVIKVNSDTQLGKDVIKCIKDGKLESIPNLIDIEMKIKKFTKDKFHIVEGEVYSYGEKVHEVISTKIIKFHEAGLPFDNLLNFWNNLKQNPSESAKDSLYFFLESNEFPLTPDGYFIAYKRISKKFRDIYTGTIDNSIGKTPEMDRALVNPDRNVTCAPGLHIASFHYAAYEYYGGDPDTLLIEVKVHPKDVVAVPYDYNNSKARTCGYEVISVITDEHKDLIVLDDKYVSEEYKESLKEPNEVKVDEQIVTEETLSDMIGSIEPEKNIFPAIKIGNYNYTPYEVITVNYDDLLNDGYRKRKPSDVPLKLQSYCGYKVKSLFSTKYKNKILYVGSYYDGKGNIINIYFE